jgi:GNAT superfamily N-acetyltransferase
VEIPGMALTITPVQTAADRHQFYRFAFQVYRDDPHWVPHLWPQRKAYLEMNAAFFSYGEGEFWLAKRDGQVVGTIGTAIDHARNRDRSEQVAIFGFFEVLPGDYETAAAMWQHACAWARTHGMIELQGPYSFAANEDPGFLVQGFDCAPAIMMGHNPPYYAKFAERFGFEKLLDGLAYRYDFSQIDFDIENAPAVLKRIAGRCLERHGAGAVRRARLAEWDQEILRLHVVYNKSLAVLPDFSPLELAEFRSQALALKPLLDPDLVMIAELDGRAVGFSLGLPNINEALIHANGLQYPWDYLRLALARRKITGASYKILALDPAAWGHGLEAVMFLEMGRTLMAKGYTWADGSLTSEDNPQTNKLATRFGARVYRRYRQFRLRI